MAVETWQSEELRREWEDVAYLPPCPRLVWAARFLTGLAVGLSVADELLGGVPLGWGAAAAVVLAGALSYRAYWCRED